MRHHTKTDAPPRAQSALIQLKHCGGHEHTLLVQASQHPDSFLPLTLPADGTAHRNFSRTQWEEGLNVYLLPPIGRKYYCISSPHAPVTAHACDTLHLTDEETEARGHRRRQRAQRLAPQAKVQLIN